MRDFTYHIPPGFFQNANVKHLADVFDKLKAFKDDQVVKYSNAINPYTNKDPNFVNKFLFEVGQMPILSGMPVYLQERLILNAYDLWGKKGGLEGLELLIWAYADGTVTQDFSNWWPPAMLVLDDIEFGYLPAGTDLHNAVDDPNEFLYLFSNSFSYYYGTIAIEIKSDELPDGLMRRQFMQVLPRFLLMCEPGTTNITVTFRKLDNTLLETLNI